MIIRFRCAEATNVNLYGGLSVASASAVDASSVIQGTTFLGFNKPAGGTVLNGINRTASTTTTTQLESAFAASTWYQFEMRISGLTGVEYFWNGTRTASAVALTGAAVTPTIGLTNGNAASRALDIESAVFVQEII
jgi:hypothetical protein